MFFMANTGWPREVDPVVLMYLIATYGMYKKSTLQLPYIANIQDTFYRC